MTVYDDGQGPRLYAGGYSASATQTDGRIARWDGAQWTLLPAAPIPYGVMAMRGYDPDGPGPQPSVLVASGLQIVQWDGASWSVLGSGLQFGAGETLAVFDDDGPGPLPPMLWVGGTFVYAGGVFCSCIARWDGAQWHAVGSGTPENNHTPVHALRVFDEDGPGPARPALIAAGKFQSMNGVPCGSIARWDGSGWSAYGDPSYSNGLYWGEIWSLGEFDPDGPAGAPARLLIGSNPLSGSFTGNRLASIGCPVPCIPNCDQSTAAPVLNVLDFACFLNRFAAGDDYANCDQSTTAPVLNVLDFSCFLNRFAAGCP
jgi:hypothetical protein